MVIRYLVALVVAALIVGAAWTFCLQIRREFVGALRKAVEATPRTPENAAGLDAAQQALDLGEVPDGGFGLEVSDPLMRRIMIADMLSGLWPFWMLLVTGLCLSGAWCAGWLGRSFSRPSPTEEAVSSQVRSAGQP